MSNRELIFISHANPESNEFVRWLASNLAREGYRVWSDVTRLIGGESFWRDIAGAIRDNTIKFIFVLSKESNDPSRRSVNELILADNVGRKEQISDFIVPIRVDDLPFLDMHVLLQQLNVIDFKSEGWAIGLARLSEKLRKDSVPRPFLDKTKAMLLAWWQTHVDRADLVTGDNELMASNWFPITGAPIILQIHTLTNGKSLSRDDVTRLPFPSYLIANKLISFASASELGFEAEHTEIIPVEDYPDSNRVLLVLYKRAWLNLLSLKNVSLHSISSGKHSAYYTKSGLGIRRCTYNAEPSLKCSRNLIGKYHVKDKERESKERYWHFGISCEFRFAPLPALAIRGHVFFSDDGDHLWDSDKRMHSTRRTYCRNWWNDAWRDRMLVFISQLLDTGQNVITIPLSPTSSLTVSGCPIFFQSPVTLNDKELRATRTEDIETRIDDEEITEEIEEEV